MSFNKAEITLCMLSAASMAIYGCSPAPRSTYDGQTISNQANSSGERGMPDWLMVRINNNLNRQSVLAVKVNNKYFETVVQPKNNPLYISPVPDEFTVSQKYNAVFAHSYLQTGEYINKFGERQGNIITLVDGKGVEHQYKYSGNKLVKKIRNNQVPYDGVPYPKKDSKKMAFQTCTTDGTKVQIFLADEIN